MLDDEDSVGMMLFAGMLAGGTLAGIVALAAGWWISRELLG